MGLGEMGCVCELLIVKISLEVFDLLSSWMCLETVRNSR